MEKDYYNKVHKHFAKKYRTSELFIAYIRSKSITENLSLKEIAKNAVLTMNLPRKKKANIQQTRSRSKQYYQSLINFIATLSDDAFLDITTKLPL